MSQPTTDHLKEEFMRLAQGGSDTKSFKKHKRGEKVGGYHVGDKIKNFGSFASSGIDDVLEGVHHVPMSAFEVTHPNKLFYAKNDIDRVHQLAEQVKQNKYLDPLLVAIDEQGPYVLEGGHRLGAAHLLGMDEIPAIIGREKIRKADGGSVAAQEAKAKLDQLKQEFMQLAERDSRAQQAAWNAEQMANKKAKGGFVNDAHRKWFGESKIKNKKGHPLTVYHGSENEIKQFDPQKSKHGFWFSVDPSDAEDYGSEITEAHLSIKNPAHFKRYRGDAGILEAMHKARKNGHDGMVITAPTYEEGGDENGMTWPTNYVAFHPSQIKHATNNRGTYDPTNPDITMAKGGSALDKKLAEFIKDSKVQQRLYHGTKSDIKKFDINKTRAGSHGSGFYFTESPSMASSYAGEGEGANVMPAYLSLKNPVIVRGTNSASDLRDLFPKAQTEDQLTTAMISAGHDGLIRIGKNGQIAEAVAFKPHQIKSAIGNRGTYDPTHPDITMAKGGSTLEFERGEHGYEEGVPRSSEGEAGYGIYAYPKSNNAMRKYYTSRGENIVSIVPHEDASILDFTNREHAQRALEEAKRISPSGKTSATLATIHKHPWALKAVAQQHGAHGYIVHHRGEGIPTGKQLIITDDTKFNYAKKPSANKAKGGNVSIDGMRYALTMKQGKKHG